MVTKKTPAKKPAVEKKAAPRKTAPKKVVEEVKPVRKPRVKKVYGSAKEEATAKKQPWVAVLETHVNPQDPGNGFFELDWNEYFIVQLKQAGFFGESEEAIVDQWFKELCKNIGADEGVDMERRGSGYINVQKVADGKAEIS